MRLSTTAIPGAMPRISWSAGHALTAGGQLALSAHCAMPVKAEFCRVYAPMNALTPSITLSGKPLTFASLARIGAHQVALTADPAALRRVELARDVVEA